MATAFRTGSSTLRVDGTILRTGTNYGFSSEPEAGDALRTAVVTAVAEARDEDVIEEDGRSARTSTRTHSTGPFQDHQLEMALQFAADTTTVTIVADHDGNPLIRIESHR